MDAAISRIERAAAAVDPVLRSVRRDQLDLPTPCAEWDLRALLDHLFGTVHGMTARVTGADAGGTAPTLADAGDDVARAWQDARDPLLAALRVPGNVEREGVGMWLGIMPIELLVHGWDAARASGASTDLDAGLADELLATARPLIQRFGRGEAFAEEQPAPPGCGAADRLAAFYGRRVT